MYVTTGTQTLDQSTRIRRHRPLATSLEVLPNDILFLIMDCLLDDLHTRFEGEERHVPLGSLNVLPCNFQHGTEQQACPENCSNSLHFKVAEFQAFAASSLIGLGGLASASRRLSAIAQPMLFRAPVLNIGSQNRWYEGSPIYLFARTLLQNPGLGRCITSLRLEMPGSWGPSMETRAPGPLEAHRMGASFIDSLDWMENDAKTGWKWQLQRLRLEPFCAIILSLVPNLRELYILQGKGPVGDIFSDMFWSTSTQWLSEGGYSRALRSLRQCPGLAKLERFRTDSLEPLSKAPLKEITTLTSLHLTANIGSVAFMDLRASFLHRIKTLRFDCNLSSDTAQLPPTLAFSQLHHFVAPPPPPGHTPPNIVQGPPPPPPPGFHTIPPPPIITVQAPPPPIPALPPSLLAALPNLETLELFASAEESYESYFHRTLGPGHGCVERKRYVSLVKQCEVLAPTLRKLVLPRGWWTWPNRDPLLMLQFDDETLEGLQPGAYTGSIANFSEFLYLETLVLHSTAVIVKGAQETEVADPAITLPTSLKHITVYGAHDGLWSWVAEILDQRGSYFPQLRSITLLREEPVKGLELSPLSELKSKHEVLWSKICTCNIALQGDV